MQRIALSRARGAPGRPRRGRGDSQRPPGRAEADEEISSVLRHALPAMAEAFAAALGLMPRWKIAIEAARDDRAAFLKREFHAFVDYLREYFRTGDPTYKQLFTGEKIKSLYDPEADKATRRRQTEAVDRAELEGIERAVRSLLSPDAWQLLAAEIRSVHQLLEADAVEQRVLFVGDCLFLDVVPFIVGELLAGGVQLLPDYATSKNPVELRQQLRGFGDEAFDCVFFSPFSYEFAPEYAVLEHLRAAFRREDAVDALVDRVWHETRTTLDLLADLFDCPIHVHNSAAVVREESAAKRVLVAAATARVRRRARRRVDQLLREHVGARNAASFKQLFVLDEAGLVESYGELRAGAFFYRSELQHPAVMGRVLAPRFVDLLYADARLATKKLIVCDLDNTLWHGVIGEGEVAHHHDRQQLLKELKDKGVVLAINSKNDPANVHWRGATLCEEDFVCAAISWDPKPHGMRRIQDELNLKSKDFVFIDDRQDELEMMQRVHPEILCLDATRAETWSRLAAWRDLLEDDPGMDRTLMYRQREDRKSFAREQVASDEEMAALFGALQLQATVRPARAADLKRVAELINRTNQFNLEGSRTSVKEVAQWHASPSDVVLLAQTADRFGDMGTTCVAAAHFGDEEMTLLPFVLSCRVFGYGVERVVMNRLKELAAQRRLRRIVGRYVATPQNGPCKDFLAGNGFREEGGRWVFDLGSASPPDPEWMTVVEEELAVR